MGRPMARTLQAAGWQVRGWNRSALEPLQISGLHFCANLQEAARSDICLLMLRDSDAVDEVLAVGDLAFQRKCLGKMDKVAASGRTILFVSHNLGAVRELCGRVLLLTDGRVEFDGPAEEGVAGENTRGTTGQAKASRLDRRHRPGRVSAKDLSILEPEARDALRRLATLHRPHEFRKR